ncbi:MAG: HAD hydrolase-like protein [Candidatus Woykebacteria bacterium]
MIKAIIFDFGYTIYDPENEKLVDGAIEALEEVHEKGLKLALVSRTKDVQKRLEQISNLGLNTYFDYIEVMPLEGTKEFDPIIEKFGFEPQEFLVVGDRVRSEIKIGNQKGMETCQFLFGPRLKELPEKSDEKPNHKINKVSEVVNLV